MFNSLSSRIVGLVGLVVGKAASSGLFSVSLDGNLMIYMRNEGSFNPPQVRKRLQKRFDILIKKILSMSVLEIGWKGASIFQTFPVFVAK